MPRKALKKGQEVKKLDKEFSKYIRLRDSEMGYGRCCTCNELKNIKEAHAGHFISRGCMLTRWHESNVHLQCCGCNTYRNGEQAKYLVFLESKYGRETVDELMALERKWKIENKSGLGVVELREMQKHYKEKAKELENLL